MPNTNIEVIKAYAKSFRDFENWKSAIIIKGAYGFAKKHRARPCHSA
jgi:hypothetical protein